MRPSKSVSAILLIIPTAALGPHVLTTTGPIVGSEVVPGVLAWKGIPFASPPVGPRRWTLPVLNKWTETKNTTALGPACIQQYDKSKAKTDVSQIFFNTPPLAESEDCLTINVWAPSNSTGTAKAVIFWIYGGGLSTGGSGTFFYDGASFAKNQDIIVVSHNYRTNLFGFPSSPEIPLKMQNLGFFDQHLALSWTKNNIAQFGGDPSKMTLFGNSAGSFSASLLVEIFPHDPPFHAAIFSSDVSIGTTNSEDAPAPVGDFTIWNTMATHFGCSKAKGPAQLDCMKAIPAQDLEQFTIDASLGFGPPSDGGITVPDDPSKLINSGNVARVPIMIGYDFNGASFETIGLDNFTDAISQPPLNAVSPDVLRALYPVPAKFPSDTQAITALLTDINFRCPSGLFAALYTNKNLSTVYRFVYGAVFPQFQVFPNAGSPEGTELPLVFGNANTTNATELALSKTLQTIWANFAKDPSMPPAPNWPAFGPTNSGVAQLAFHGNVALEDVVEVTNSSDMDAACQLFNSITF